MDRLKARPTRITELALEFKITKSTVRSQITRLRKEGYAIHSETTETSGDNRYRLLAGPQEPIRT